MALALKEGEAGPYCLVGQSPGLLTCTMQDAFQSRKSWLDQT